MDPLDRARVLAKLLLDSVPEAKEGDKTYDLGALCPKVFTQTNCEESMTADWEYINPIYNRFLGSQFSVEVVSGEIHRGKNGVDGLLFSGVVYQVPSLGQVLISGQAGFAVGGHEEDFT